MDTIPDRRKESKEVVQTEKENDEVEAASLRDTSLHRQPLRSYEGLLG